MYKLLIQKVPSRSDHFCEKYKAFISKAFLWISGNSHGILKRELDVMRVWFLRAFVVFFLDFVLFSQSFHGHSLDMFLRSCFLNKTNFSCFKNLWIQLYPSLPISILIVSKVALFGLLPPSTFFMKWASPSTFFYEMERRSLS